MSEPIPEGKEDFELAQTRLSRRYFTVTITENDFICPREDPENEMLRWVDSDYCDSSGMGQGCKYKSQCPDYLKAKRRI